MTNFATAEKEKLRGIFDIDNLPDATFKIMISPVSAEEADEIEFRSLKGIAGRPLDRDAIRRERLKI